MTTTDRQLIQTNPGKAGELFAKLADTSGTALKTRERLLAELKAELELQAQFEERHLLPVLEKHEGTRGLVADARDDNQRTRKLLAELERAPKDGEAFLAKAAELREAFQQHLRDEKKEFLPAVAKALSDEEAGAAIREIGDGKAGLEAARRADADQPRAEAEVEAKGERDEAGDGAARQAASAATGTAPSGADAARGEAGTAARRTEGGEARAGAARRSDAGERSAGAATPSAADTASPAPEMARAGAEMARQGATVMRSSARAGANAADDLGRDLGGAARSAAPSEEEREATRETAESAAEIGRSVVALLGEQTRHAVETAAALGRARTLAEAAEAQADFVGASFGRAARLNGRYLALARSGMGALPFAARR